MPDYLFNMWHNYQKKKMVERVEAEQAEKVKNQKKQKLN
eukprot:CAMPEP_0116899002 /NCGR_PEP_ID=MMETSP0467-20121206/7644_1 /TAXON_ID=283647 /ORGANISM="Mesodinium pulex, Strain SPMC105" /LENGTH=38 /DNA_ID= /DNA_START= /DNA_END= /DNA_ORIENTATION=